MSDDHVTPDLFPNNPKNSLTGLTRQNARLRLANLSCPRCTAVGRFRTFNKSTHVGIECLACGREHPFRSRGVMWLPGEDNAWKRSQP